MSIEDSLGTALLAQAAITSAVASSPAAIWPVQPPENQKGLPRIVYTKTSDMPVYSDAGPSDLRHCTFEIECHGATIADAETLRNAVNTYLNPAAGFLGALGGNKVMRLFITDEHDTLYPSVHADEISVRSKTLEIEMDYT